LLEGLFRGALEDQAARQERVSLPALEAIALQAPPVRSAIEALRPREQVHIISEIKRRSPSKGPLADIPEPVELARAYENGGASAISVLTESRQFGGSLDDLHSVSQAVGIPVLRKDFIATDYQIVEARAHGADWVLLIMAWLGDDDVRRLLAVAKKWGMAALVETHSEEEVRRAIDCGAEIIGVNARDLGTFDVDKELFGRLVPLFPEGIIRVAESAVANSQDVSRYREQGAHAVLVGEALVTGANPEGRVREFVSA
jgi:indole-3-glycerol phosphate synthase